MPIYLSYALAQVALDAKAFAADGVTIKHHFSGKEYAKETGIEAGKVLTQHEHPHDHLSVLAQGTAVVEVDGVRETHVGPCCLVIKAGSAHSVEAVTDVVWFCIHATGETDPSKVDETILRG